MQASGPNRKYPRFELVHLRLRFSWQRASRRSALPEAQDPQHRITERLVLVFLNSTFMNELIAFPKETKPIYPEGPTVALNTHTILVTRHDIQTAAERNRRIGMHANANSAGNNAMHEDHRRRQRKSEDSTAQQEHRQQRSGMPSSGIDDPDLDPPTWSGT
ncbi:hypothetical protein THAOC_37341 [Thalassiosira oceanica]|uniref:Uncharacterized protein n=1 Tax=Thalassiosira oceanica TaxID=159749 RepID=K0QYY6_THAOC|nr:hypothetical protein THAOC_37341 [Thalassiosira oceanica]|eukprot:EJK44145.1 hypothetical protein THAOC_37341 [Thalassiosira oceanica]